MKSPAGSCQVVKRDAKDTTPKLQSEAIASPYAYSPIRDNQFRLVEIQPGQFDDPLVCQIFHGCIGEGEYEAISYTWADESGDQDQTQDIIVCSSLALGPRTVKATRNCESALRRVRSITDARIIWIDALCIDQSNFAERGHQVHKMPHIYANASKVIVYLGEASSTSEQLLNAINDLRFGAHLDSHLEGHVQDFLSRRWFSRVWCLQEVGMANYVEMICGAQTVPFERLVLANLDKCAPKSGGRLPLILRLPMQEKQSLNHLYDLLEDARASCAASDPRDMVYALLGLVSVSDIKFLQPDYEISIADTFNKTTEFLVNYYGSLDFLTQAQTRSLQDAALASWAIDWTAKTQHKQTTIDTSSMSQTTFGSGGTKGSFTFKTVEGARVLSATGRKYCSVMVAAQLSVSSKYRGPQNEWASIRHNGIISAPPLKVSQRIVPVTALSPDAQFNIATIISILSGGAQSPPWDFENWHSDTVIDRSQSRDQDVDWNNRPEYKRYLGESSDHGMRWKRPKKHNFDETLDDPAFTDDVLESINDFDTAFWRWIFDMLASCEFWQRVSWTRPVHESAMFILDDFTIGIGPPDLAYGDTVFQLESSSVWHFLRQEGDHYRLIGEYCALPSATLPNNVADQLARLMSALRINSFAEWHRGPKAKRYRHAWYDRRFPRQAKTCLGACFESWGCRFLSQRDWDGWIAFWEQTWARQTTQAGYRSQSDTSNASHHATSCYWTEDQPSLVCAHDTFDKLFAAHASSTPYSTNVELELIDIW